MVQAAYKPFKRTPLLREHFNHGRLHCTTEMKGSRTKKRVFRRFGEYQIDDDDSYTYQL